MFIFGDVWSGSMMFHVEDQDLRKLSLHIIPIIGLQLVSNICFVGKRVAKTYDVQQIYILVQCPVAPPPLPKVWDHPHLWTCGWVVV